MTLPVVFRKAAQKEFDGSTVWYETQKPGLGGEFIAAVERVLDQIADRPELYQIIEGDVRRAVVSRFPYCVYYRALPDRVVVIAVFNASRSPSAWRRR